MRYLLVPLLLLGHVARADCERFTTRMEDLARLIANHPTEERRGEKAELAAVLQQLDACRDQHRKDAERTRQGRGEALELSIIEGATVCMLDGKRAATLREIATEKKYSKAAGVENMSKLYLLQRRLRAIDETKKHAVAEQKARPDVKPAMCTNPIVRRMLECDADTSSEACDEDTKYLVGFLPPIETNE